MEKEQEESFQTSPLELSTEIISAYVSNNTISPRELVQLIGEVHTAVSEISDGHSVANAVGKNPAVPAKQSVTPDYLICLEDGKRFKSLKRHLRSHYKLSPDQYRTKWGLPSDYPMVAPNYAKERSRLAKEMRLGHSRGA